MIQSLDERVASIIKAMNETETPVRRSKLNPLTRLNNEIVKLQVQDSKSLEFFKELEGRKGDDN